MMTLNDKTNKLSNNQASKVNGGREFDYTQSTYSAKCLYTDEYICKCKYTNHYLLKEDAVKYVKLHLKNEHHIDNPDGYFEIEEEKYLNR